MAACKMNLVLSEDCKCGATTCSNTGDPMACLTFRGEAECLRVFTDGFIEEGGCAVNTDPGTSVALGYN